jgi:serine/threonine protein kinase/tetratricopeptide (TPR) repeat protein
MTDRENLSPDPTHDKGFHPPSPARWRRIKELFYAAIEQSPAQRSEYLRQICGEDLELCQEVESLLASSVGAEASTLSAVNVSQAGVPPKDFFLGRRLGPYRILTQIACGGMATVYLAERADDAYRQRVAIKVVQQGLDNVALLNRFRNERQTLASLNHPNIVKLLDGGSTEDGSPYLVMEYVDGVPVDQYCDSHALSVKDRLLLFRTVCSAVQYAHDHRVIHRDLKPGNILVTAEGAPRLLDFGIAKLFDPGLALESLATTQTGMRLMTPSYASPEQIRGEPLSHLTDVYSLGVLLYEMLTARGPYHLKRHTPLEIERAVCEEEPERPSAAVNRVEGKSSAPAAILEAISRARNTSPEKLRHTLRGDLDAIVLKSLRKEPQLRYASVKDFSEDVQCYLQNLPVKARQGSLRYRGTRFIRRRRTEVAAGILMLLALVGAMVTVRWEVRRANERGRLQAEPARRFETRRSLAVLGFKNLSARDDTNWLATALSQMLTTELAAGEQLRVVPGETVAQMKVSLALPDSDSLSPETLQRIRSNLGTDLVVLGAYTDLGPDSGKQIRFDLRLQDAHQGEIVAAVAETGTESTLFDLVSRAGSRLRAALGVRQVTTTETTGIRAALPSDPEAARLYSEGLAKLQVFDALAAKDLLSRAVSAEPSHALARSALASAWAALGYDEAATNEARKAFARSQALAREDRLWIEGQYREASQEWDRAIEIYRTLYTFFPDNLEYGLRLASVQGTARKGQDALTTVRSLRELPDPERHDPRIDLAEAAAEETLGDFRLTQRAAEAAASKAQARRATLLLAHALYVQGWTLRNLGESEHAMTVLERGRQIYESVGDRGNLARTLNHIGVVVGDRGDFAGAVKTYQESLAISRQIGDKHAEAATLNNLALAYWQQPGKLTAAKMIFEELIVTDRTAGDVVGTALAEYNLGLVLGDLGDVPGAVTAQERALDRFRKIGRKSSIAMVQSYLGLLRMHQGLFGPARTAIEEGLAIRTNLGEKGGIATSRLILAALDLETHREQEAEDLALKAATEFHAENRPDLEAYSRAGLALSLIEQHKLSEANAALPDASALAEKIGDPHVRCSVQLAAVRLLAASGNHSEASDKAQKTLDLARSTGLAGCQLEARILIGQNKLQSGQVTAGIALLSAVEKEARSHGDILLARKAAEAKTEAENR